MVTKAVVSHYYEGQGRLSAGLRSSDGMPTGLRPMGNVSELSLAVAGDMAIIKRPVNGRLVDMESYTRGTTVKFRAKIESVTARNLAMLTHGAYGDEQAARVENAPVKGYFGALQPLSGMAPVNMAVTAAGTTLTPYVSDGYAWDYMPSEGGAGLVLNDGVDAPLDKLKSLAGTLVTAAALPAPGVVRLSAVLPTGLQLGQRVVLLGFTDPALAPYLARAVTIAAFDNTAKTVDVVLPGIVASPDFTAGRILFDGMSLSASYDSAAFSQYTATIDNGGEFFMRFDGMNLADADGAPVTVEISRVKIDPSAVRDLLTEELATIELTGTVLYDRFRPHAPFYTEKFLTLTSDGIRDPSMGTVGFFRGWGGSAGGGPGGGWTGGDGTGGGTGGTGGGTGSSTFPSSDWLANYLDGKIALEQLAADAQALLQQLQDTDADFQAQVDAFKAEAAANKLDLDTLTAEVTAHSLTLTDQSNALSQEITDRTTQASTLETNLQASIDQAHALAEQANTTANSAVTNLTLETDTRATQVTNLITQTQGQANALGALGSRVTTVESTTVDQALRLTELETTSVGADSRITTLETTSADQAARLTTLETSQGDLTSRITTVETTTTAQANRLTTLETSDAAHDSRIATLETTSASDATRITTLETSVSGHTSSIQTLQQTTSDQANTLTTLTHTAEKRVTWRAHTRGVNGPGVTGMFDLDGANTINVGTSWIVVEFSAVGAVTASTVYPVSTDAAKDADLRLKLDGIADGQTVLVLGYGDPALNLSAATKTSLARCGGTVDTLDALKAGAAYLLLGVAGMGEGAGTEIASGLQVANDAAAAADLTFDLINGRPANLPGSTGVRAAITSLQTVSDSQASTLSQLTLDVNTNHSAITDLQSVTAGQASRLTTLESSVDTNTSSITSMQATQASQAVTMSELQTSDSQQASTITAMQQTTTDTAQQVTDLSTRMETAEASLVNELITRAGKDAVVIDQLNLMDGRLVNAEASVTASASTVSGYETRMTAVEGTTTSNTSNITSLTNRVTGLDGKTDATNTSVSGLTSRVTTAEGTITSQGNAITSLTSRLTTAEGNITATSNGLNTLTTRVTTAEGTITSQGQAITSLQSSLDSKTVTIVQPTQPTSAGRNTGDIWVDSDDNNKVYVWNGSVWQVTTDNTKNKTFVQAAAPTATAVGDLWFDSDDSYKMYRWTGSAWDPVQDGRISANATAITGLTTRVTTAEGNITSQSSSITSLSSRVTTAEGNITSQASAISGLQTSVNSVTGKVNASYTLRLDANKHITGFTFQNDGTVGAMAIVADYFSIVGASSGARTEFSGGNWRVYDTANVLRVRMGVW